MTQRSGSHGQLHQRTFLNATGNAALITTTASYDGNLRPTHMQVVAGTAGAALFETGRAYDPLGNVNAVRTTHASIPGEANSGGSETQAFCYDTLNRLSWASNIGSPPAEETNCSQETPSSGLSGAGYTNRYLSTNLDQMWQGPIADDGAQYQYLYCEVSAPRQLSGVYPPGTTCANRGDTFSYRASYDAWGNLSGREYNGQTEQLIYDPFDQLITWKQNGTDAQERYAYGGDSQRLLRLSTTSSGTTITMTPFGRDEYHFSDTWEFVDRTHYYALDGQLLGKDTGPSSSVQFFLTDDLGSVQATIQEVGGAPVVQGNQVYSPYGTERYHKGEMGTSRGYTGQYGDETTGLDYYNARYYDPAIGRFLSADSAWGNPQGADPYTYVNGSPITYNDPSGHWAHVAIGAGLGALWGGGSDVVSQLVSTGQVDWSQVGKEAAAGAIGGAIAALIPGAGLLMGFVNGAVDGAVSRMASNLFNGRSPGDGVLESAMWGGGFGAVAGKIFGGRPSSLCGNSFSADTTVATPEGEQAISDLEVGDQVVAMDPETRKPSTQTVEAVFTTHHSGDLMDVTLTVDKGKKEARASSKRPRLPVMAAMHLRTVNRRRSTPPRTTCGSR